MTEYDARNGAAPDDGSTARIEPNPGVEPRAAVEPTAVGHAEGGADEVASAVDSAAGESADDASGSRRVRSSAFEALRRGVGAAVGTVASRSW